MKAKLSRLSILNSVFMKISRIIHVKHHIKKITMTISAGEKLNILKPKRCTQKNTKELREHMLTVPSPSNTNNIKYYQRKLPNPFLEF